MFDIGFAELLIIGVVALLVIGPERLPGAVRTASAWLNRFRRSFNDIKQEVQQELHNDAVMRELKETGESLRRETDALRKDLSQPLEPAVEKPTTAITADSTRPDTGPSASDDNESNDGKAP